MKDPTDRHCSKFMYLTGRMWSTRFIPLIISTHDKVEVVMHVDGAHDVHADGKGHSGMILTKGTGAMTSASKNIGVVTISSTEREIVADRERFPKCSWFICFRLAQGDSSK